MRTFTVRVNGRPAPQGSKRYVGKSKKDTAILIEMSKKLKPWRKQVHEAARQTTSLEGWVPFDGPILLNIDFWLPRPVSHPKTRMTYPVGPPDLSKLIRAAEDSLTTSGVWVDDSRVVRTTSTKSFAIPLDLPKLRALVSDETPSEPGAFIQIWGRDFDDA